MAFRRESGENAPIEDITKDGESPYPERQTGSIYDREEAVSFEVWQTELAFDRLDGSSRETKARNSKDAQEWYDNYVETWSNADAQTRFDIDWQHGFFGGNLSDPADPDTGGGGGGGGGGGSNTPDPITPVNDDAEDISPTPDDDSNNFGSDNTPEDNESAIESEVNEDRNEDGTVKDGADSQEQEKNDDSDSLLTVRDVTPEDEVVDPATGTRYTSPEDARRSGITNWVYAHEYDGG